MLNTIKAFESAKLEEVKHTTMVKSDDGTLVFFKDNYDQNTGEKLPDEVVKTVTEQEIKDEVAKKQEEIAVLQGFLSEISIN